MRRRRMGEVCTGEEVQGGWTGSERDREEGWERRTGGRGVGKKGRRDREEGWNTREEEQRQDKMDM